MEHHRLGLLPGLPLAHDRPRSQAERRLSELRHARLCHEHRKHLHGPWHLHHEDLPGLRRQKREQRRQLRGAEIRNRLRRADCLRHLRTRRQPDACHAHRRGGIPALQGGRVLCQRHVRLRSEGHAPGLRGAVSNHQGLPGRWHLRGRNAPHRQPGPHPRPHLPGLPERHGLL